MAIEFAERVPETVGDGHYQRQIAEHAGIKHAWAQGDLPLSVRDVAVFLGVSRQTVYLWVERKQIPHLRVMGRNIRFLRSDLEPFRAQFKQEVENGETKQA